MSVREEIIRVLGERATHRINFNYGRVRVDPAAFQFVQGLFRDNRVNIGTDPHLTSGGASARYDRGTSTMFLWPRASGPSIRGNAESKGLIVHECVHVLTHFRYGSHVCQIDDEIVAFLAQTIYRLGIQGYVHSGSRERGGSFSTEIQQHGSTTGGQIFAAAQEIVLAHHLLDGTGCTPLFAEHVEPLRLALQPYVTSS